MNIEKLKTFGQGFAAFFMAFFLTLGAAEASQAAKLRIIVFGDSLTSGYQLQPEEAFPARLQRKLEAAGYENFEIINMSAAAETAASGIDKVSTIMAKHPDIVIVSLGTNDAIRGVRPETIYNNIGTIVNRMRDKTYVILMGAKAPASMGYSYSAQLDASYDVIANMGGVSHIGYYPGPLDGIIGHADLTLADEFHPNAKGVDVIVEGIYRIVDAGLRWKIESLRYQQEYERAVQQQLLEQNGISN